MAESEGFFVYSKELELVYRGNLDELDLIGFLESVMGRIISYSVVYGSRRYYGREYSCTTARVRLRSPFIHNNAIAVLTYTDVRPYINVHRSNSPEQEEAIPSEEQVGCCDVFMKLVEPPRQPAPSHSVRRTVFPLHQNDRREQAHSSTIDPAPYTRQPPVTMSLPAPVVGNEAMKWQQALLDDLQKLHPSGKACGTIIWYWDGIGGCGKSTVVRMIRQKYGADVAILTSGSREGDVAQVLVSAADKNKKIPPRVVVDLSASYTDTPNLYSSLDSISNGTITATKYHSDTLIFDVSHVVVLAGFLPDTTSMSEGRIEVRELKKKDDGSVGCWKRTSDDMPALRDLEKKYTAEKAARATVKRELSYD